MEVLRTPAGAGRPATWQRIVNPFNHRNRTIIIMKKSVSWIQGTESAMLDQFDQFTIKIAGGGYAAKYGLSPAQLTATRNDCLWLRYAITCTQQFEQEWRRRVMWKDQLKTGPSTSIAAQVPGVGSEFVAPAVAPVPNGVLTRWRDLVGYIKNHMNYEKADGVDLGIEAVNQPAQTMKPTARLRAENGHVVRIKAFKDGHDSVVVWCRRGNETQPVRLGVYRLSDITDDRPNLAPGVPEQREYWFQMWIMTNWWARCRMSSGS